mgnify:CR=1 FL=1
MKRFKRDNEVTEVIQLALVIAAIVMAVAIPLSPMF